MEFTEAFIIPIIIALVELMKRSGVPKKALPFISMVLGVVFSVVYMFPNDIKIGIITGLVIGLSASGAYTGAKTIIKENNVVDKR